MFLLSAVHSNEVGLDKILVDVTLEICGSNILTERIRQFA
jgi:hypothetical protein